MEYPCGQQNNDAGQRDALRSAHAPGSAPHYAARCSYDSESSVDGKTAMWGSATCQEALAFLVPLPLYAARCSWDRESPVDANSNAEQRNVPRSACVPGSTTFKQQDVSGTGDGKTAMQGSVMR
ncbi:hypothetical protein NDU88_004299 [Pleurodeles waltl]|uniref:Uncharacterized protein n=1 Tax=Pleurodeles waltl TaxID=8319 RepID=A0AAV7MU56_PLEWA|nr:hypothetical protein NDU88_004299 [Pleurodeles waltl]